MNLPESGEVIVVTVPASPFLATRYTSFVAVLLDVLTKVMLFASSEPLVNLKVAPASPFSVFESFYLYRI